MVTIHELEIGAIMIEASDQGDHAESKPNLFDEDEDYNWFNWDDEDKTSVSR
ncbi:hypothetical protein [Segatella salivae]|uniref:hypothetical protein n=1 Tax=Segatella salivae TaxID=228604 RepID=UPI00241F4F55|nr:hypothetical protein [Segatella salivae]